MIVSGWYLPAELVAEYGVLIAKVTRDRIAKPDLIGYVPYDLRTVLEELEQESRRLKARRTAGTTSEPTSDGGQPHFRGETLDTEQARALIGCSTTRNVVDLVRRGRLKGRQLPDRTWQIDAQSVTEYLEVRNGNDRKRAS